MSDEWLNYVNDARTICKYGSKCYQKNPQHNIAYKHPPSKTNRRKNLAQHRFSPYSNDGKQKQANIDNNSRETQTEQESSKDEINKESKEELNATVKQIVEDKKTDKKPTLNLEQDGVNYKEENELSVESKKVNEDWSVTLQDNLTFFDATTSPDIFKDLFLVEMPSDFFEFYKCLNVDNAFEKTLSSVNLKPIGPYDLLLGKLPKLKDKQLYLSHWRFFYDPPEFQVTIKRKYS